MSALTDRELKRLSVALHALEQAQAELRMAARVFAELTVANVPEALEAITMQIARVAYEAGRVQARALREGRKR